MNSYCLSIWQVMRIKSCDYARMVKHLNSYVGYCDTKDILLIWQDMYGKTQFYARMVKDLMSAIGLSGAEESCTLCTCFPEEGFKATCHAMMLSL